MLKFARIACNPYALYTGGRTRFAPTDYTQFPSHQYIFIKQKYSSSGRIMTSRLKYSRNALCINALSIARYFRQRYAPFFRHWRRSQDYPYERGCLRGIHSCDSNFHIFYCVHHKEITALCCSTRRLLKNN